MTQIEKLQTRKLHKPLTATDWIITNSSCFPIHISSIPSAPENITVTFINPTSVRVSWQQPMDIAYPIEKFDVTYKPTDARKFGVSEELYGYDEKSCLTYHVL
ncbi:CLUMA_CG015916, isoform A [Clunio marinus]|uniref:CLUMA_CG015916, isoform A n=1 Tax=Clunio marinus TaxID=568069 RepID=A0A1J1IT14_9DIPT|nr:CLUMA_CG015916, isoform A [Clunio marinus]